MEVYFTFCLTTYLDIAFGMVRQVRDILFLIQIGPFAASVSFKRL